MNTKVTPIKNGIVLDHLEPHTALKIVELLNIKEHNDIITIGLNLESKKFGKKDILKIEGHKFSKKDFEIIALLSKNATISVIENGIVFSKNTIPLPEVIQNVCVCPNKKCITNFEHIKTCFTIEQKSHLQITCFFCERTFSLKGITFVRNKLVAK